ncbi:hypothetical protein KIN20_030427 [Parelaphostrongylus tenuis]|uniref:Uncharacterized protein n=1 Tax=Parelaphostrongylus tenuis TaxID=148309 RepID=A0AAD5R3R0_PARTN|nr:hypothetical protein KIN20_030427 [Parelaphostrongylus tenuis]
MCLVSAFHHRARREDKIQRYCHKHLEHYRNYCSGNSEEVDSAARAKLAKFCPAYERHCSGSKDDSSESEVLGNLVLPPPLPKANDFVAMDLPIDTPIKAAPSLESAPSKTLLTAAIIASCTPECTAPHCTDECKCANTHPKVHGMCNPPANAKLADICQKWYEKCPMFQPIQF